MATASVEHVRGIGDQGQGAGADADDHFAGHEHDDEGERGGQSPAVGVGRGHVIVSGVPVTDGMAVVV